MSSGWASPRQIQERPEHERPEQERPARPGWRGRLVWPGWTGERRCPSARRRWQRRRWQRRRWQRWQEPQRRPAPDPVLRPLSGRRPRRRGATTGAVKEGAPCASVLAAPPSGPPSPRRVGRRRSVGRSPRDGPPRRCSLDKCPLAVRCPAEAVSGPSTTGPGLGSDLASELGSDAERGRSDGFRRFVGTLQLHLCSTLSP